MRGEGERRRGVRGEGAGNDCVGWRARWGERERARERKSKPVAHPVAGAQGQHWQPGEHMNPAQHTAPQHWGRGVLAGETGWLTAPRPASSINHSLYLERKGRRDCHYRLPLPCFLSPCLPPSSPPLLSRRGRHGAQGEREREGDMEPSERERETWSPGGEIGRAHV